MVEADETKRDGSRAVIELVEADEIKRGGSCSIIYIELTPGQSAHEKVHRNAHGEIPWWAWSRTYIPKHGPSSGSTLTEGALPSVAAAAPWVGQARDPEVSIY